MPYPWRSVPNVVKEFRDTMQPYDAGGVEVTFTPAAHKGADFVDTVVVARDGRFAR